MFHIPPEFIVTVIVGITVTCAILIALATMIAYLGWEVDDDE